MATSFLNQNNVIVILFYSNTCFLTEMAPISTMIGDCTNRKHYTVKQLIEKADNIL